MSVVGRSLVILGIAIAVLGVLIVLSARLPGFRLGRLPGDVVVRRGNWTLYVPLATGLLVSLVVSLLLWLFARR